ncbi:712_t:CDS:2, partial [Cetraspora pellucida]
NEKKRTYQIGLATIKEVRGGNEEKREGLGSQAIKLLHKLVPEGVFTQVTKIDIKSCYANIMRDYPLPCGSPELITDPVMIEQKLKEGREGFVSFYARQDAVIKNNQIPFLPDSDDGKVRIKLRPYHFLHTKLLKDFNRQYGKKGKLYYKNLFIFPHKKGCINKFLNHCEEIKKTDKERGKRLINALYGVLGKNNFSGYHYHPFHLAVNHLAILQTYYLYRQFKPEDVLAIRSDCIYVKGELPTRLLKRVEQYHITKYNKWGVEGKAEVKTILQELDQELKNSCQKAGCPDFCRQIPTLPQQVLNQLKIMEDQDD